ncbi:hypothetical protein [Candidatus Nitrosocosmicus arcticus]|uniref:Uncharacterized protein n=1 Tax=Candidatus Nitrosocosmicus arcticus TaxID=2035267 RepID=A0A557SWJ4_9ARCH|nr:hypothetical protein [Candidatus Nitrosocosmicus arcticus]TVP40973.1 hypothetical protein NARC_50154 [Candidatus Nitrosocosmicus arcticus]
MSSNIDWTDVIKKEARGLNDADFGEVQEVSNGLVLTQRGIVNKELFSIPQSAVESYDGKVLRFRISENEAVDKYKKLFEPKSMEIDTDSDTEIDEVSTNTDSGKIDGVIDEVVDDTIKDVIIQPTKEEVELEIEKKVEKEVDVLNREPGIENETVKSATASEETSFDNPVNPATNQNEKSSKSLKKENEDEDETPLKKEEAGIS